jgi:hypothetical protein
MLGMKGYAGGKRPHRVEQHSLAPLDLDQESVTGAPMPIGQSDLYGAI